MVDPAKPAAENVDIWLIRENLKLSYEERVEQHQNMINLISELNQIGSEHRKKKKQANNPSSHL
jgi:hypothetical protein